MYNFIDLFCGAGGFSKGLEMAGLKCVGAIDNVEAACKTHALNHKNSVTICGDIRDISPEEFNRKIGMPKVDIIIGGPPCPTFSTIGHAKIQSVTKKDVSEDPRNRLFLEYLKYVEFFEPEIFVIENVPNFITKYKGKVFNKATEIILNIGKEKYGEGIYEIVSPVQVLNSVYYGVPQTRRRMILVAHKKNIKKFTYPKATHYYEHKEAGLKKYHTVQNAIEDLPKITDNWRISEMEYSKFENLNDFQKIMRKNNVGKTVFNNICRMSNDRAKKVFAHMKQGDIYMDLPQEVRRILPFREDIFPDRLKRLVNDQPSWTVIAHIGMDGYMYIHPTENRTLSVREAARLQSFPDEFVFLGNQQQTYIQVGNAVPPLLGKAIGKSIINYLNNE
jgi:DNA (cytosine-5)-methyltransferase 1